VTSAPIRPSIPESELPHFRTLAQSDKVVLQKLVDSLPHVGLTLDRDRLTRALAEAAALEATSVAPIVTALWRLAFAQQGFETDAVGFVNALTGALAAVSAERWAGTDTENWSERVGLVAQLLRPDGAIAICAKAVDLRAEEQLIFCRARTLTDMRPVFDESAERVQGYVLFHTLRITCHEGVETREIYISLDGSNVRDLRRQLDRALRKQDLLAATLKGAGFQTLLRTESDDE